MGTRPKWIAGSASRLLALGWLVTSSVAAVTVVSYVHAMVYPRTEGELLEKRVDRIETEIKADVKEIRKMVFEIHRKVH